MKHVYRQEGMCTDEHTEEITRIHVLDGSGGWGGGMPGDIER